MMRFRLKVFAVIAAAVVCSLGAAAASVIIPGDTEIIGDMAFYGNTSITEVVLRDSAKSIGSMAFGDCAGLVGIYVPESVDYIAQDAFEGVAAGFTMRGVDGSYAHGYAIDNGIPWNDTVRRALVIGQKDYPPGSVLNGTITDAAGVSDMLETMSLTPFSVIDKQLSLTGQQMRARISSAFIGADANDVSLFYYSGHGGSSGVLCGVDWDNVSPHEIRSMLDAVPGDKIVLIDACYSGGLIGKQMAAFAGFTHDESSIVKNMNQAWINAFSSKKRGADDLAAGGYYVMTAARSDQESWEINNGSVDFGMFTYCLLDGCGWDETSATRINELRADTNNDRHITLSEAYVYTDSEVEKLKARLGNPDVVQLTQVYPENSGFVLFGR